MIAEVARMVAENKKKLPFGLYIVNAVQEEIGLRGAEMIAHRIKPNVAIITDVTHDTQSPMYEKKVSGDLHCGKGPVVTYGPAVQNNLLQMIIDTAQKKEIPFQRAASHPGNRHRYRCLCLFFRWRSFGFNFFAAQIHAHHRRNRS